MRFGRAAVPARDGPARRVEQRLDRVPGQHRVATFDVVKAADDRLGDVPQFPFRTQPPLQIADPQNQLGDDRGAGIDLQPQELARRHGDALHVEQHLAAADLPAHLQHLGLQAHQMLQADVEEVARSAGRIEHAQARQAALKRIHLGQGFLTIALVGQARGRGLHRFPLGAQRLNQRRQHQALDVGARGKVRAQLVPLGRIEGALQQGAENGRFHVAPIGLRGFDQQL